MQSTTLTTICKAGSVLLLAVSIPWVVYGQMGMGGGGMGGMVGGLGGMESPREKWLEELAKNPVSWERPAGEVPFWLKNGKAASDATELVRNKLNEMGELDFSDESLSAFFQRLGGRTELQFDLDTKAFEDSSVGDATLTIKGVGPLRELLRRALDPLKLTYIVHENSVEITTIDAASSRPVIRHYDLGYIQSDSKNLASIITTIEQAVEPDTWINSGGYGAIIPIGQLLVVSATEKAHLGIEKLLYRLSPQSASQPVKTANTLFGGGETISPTKSNSLSPNYLVSISGVVTFRGKPLSATMLFHYQGGNSSSTRTASDGTYVITLPIGSYRITLDGKDVPPKYQNVEESPLKYEVAHGDDLFNISLDDSPTVSPPTKR